MAACTRCTSAISTPKPTIKKPPPLPDKGALVVCDYTGTAIAATKTSRATRRKAKKQGAPAAATRWTTRSSKGIRMLQVPAFSRIPWLVHGFSTRPGGASILEGKPALNLGFTEWDSRADASITNRPGLLLAVQTADCVPILLVDPRNRAVAAVHAGWRGTLQRIVAKAIGR